MTLRFNKDGEPWDTVTGTVYHPDGTVKRPGLPHTTPLPAVEAAAAIAALESDA